MKQEVLEMFMNNKYYVDVKTESHEDQYITTVIFPDLKHIFPDMYWKVVYSYDIKDRFVTVYLYQDQNFTTKKIYAIKEFEIGILVGADIFCKTRILGMPSSLIIYDNDPKIKIYSSNKISLNEEQKEKQLDLATRLNNYIMEHNFESTHEDYGIFIDLINSGGIK